MTTCAICGGEVESGEPFETEYMDEEWRPPYVEYEGERYRFCSEECKEEFESDPEAHR